MISIRQTSSWIGLVMGLASLRSERLTAASNVSRENSRDQQIESSFLGMAANWIGLDHSFIFLIYYTKDRVTELLRHEPDAAEADMSLLAWFLCLLSEGNGQDELKISELISAWIHVCEQAYYTLLLIGLCTLIFLVNHFKSFIVQLGGFVQLLFRSWYIGLHRIKEALSDPLPPTKEEGIEEEEEEGIGEEEEEGIGEEEEEGIEEEEEEGIEEEEEEGIEEEEEEGIEEGIEEEEEEQGERISA